MERLAWTPPAYLTYNTVLDHAPMLAVGHNGKIFLTWRQNAAGELVDL